MNCTKSRRECLTAAPRSICQTGPTNQLDSSQNVGKAGSRQGDVVSRAGSGLAGCNARVKDKVKTGRQARCQSEWCLQREAAFASRLLLHGPSLPIRNSYQDAAAGIDASKDSAYHKKSTTTSSSSSSSKDDHRTIGCWRLLLACLEAGERQDCTLQAHCQPDSRWALRPSLATQARAHTPNNINTKLTPPRRLSPTSTQSGRSTALTTPPIPTQRLRALTAATAATWISSWPQQTSITHSPSQQQS